MRTILTGAVLAAMTTMAQAHAMLEHATPGAGAALTASPKTLVLQYSEEIEPALSGVTVTDSAGHDVTTGPLDVETTQMSIALKPLKSGTYAVSWHAVSADTHRTEGNFRFRVK